MLVCAAPPPPLRRSRLHRPSSLGDQSLRRLPREAKRIVEADVVAGEPCVSPVKRPAMKSTWIAARLAFAVVALQEATAGAVAEFARPAGPRARQLIVRAHASRLAVTCAAGNLPKGDRHGWPPEMSRTISSSGTTVRLRNSYKQQLALTGQFIDGRSTDTEAMRAFGNRPGKAGRRRKERTLRTIWRISSYRFIRLHSKPSKMS